MIKLNNLCDLQRVLFGVSKKWGESYDSALKAYCTGSTTDWFSTPCVHDLLQKDLYAPESYSGVINRSTTLTVDQIEFIAKDITPSKLSLILLHTPWFATVTRGKNVQVMVQDRKHMTDATYQILKKVLELAINNRRKKAVVDTFVEAAKSNKVIEEIFDEVYDPSNNTHNLVVMKAVLK